jgi:hypothetical protein
MANDNDAPKLGAGHLAGMARQGLKELTQILPAFPESVRPVEEPGVFGNPTQQIVTQQMDVPGYQAHLEGFNRSPIEPEPDKDRGMSR